MFFSKKPSSSPAPARREEPQRTVSQLEENYNAILACMRERDLKFEEKREDHLVIVPMSADGEQFTLFLRANERYVRITTLTPFEIKGCTVDEATLLCAYINSHIIAGTFYPDSDDENVFIEITQRTFDAGSISAKTVGYLVGVMCSLLDSDYMKALSGLCKGYRSLDEVLGELSSK